MKSLILCAVAIILTAASCKKSAEKQLPPATQTGANTFGCKINGVVYKCQGWWKPGSIFITEGVSASFVDGKVGIVALTKIPDANLAIEFNCPNPEPGIYTKGIKLYLGRPKEGSDSHIDITRFDNNVISGTFQLEIEFADGAVWDITEGRFDIKRDNN